MGDKIIEIAMRIRGLREDFNISVEEMARIVEVSPQDYLEYEGGKRDFSFTFLYKVAHRLGLDISELLTGSSPTLSKYTHVKKGRGLSIERRKGFKYQSLAYLFKNRNAEPFLVEAGYDEAADEGAILQRSHDGQEFDYILSGSLKVKIDDHEFIMEEGDSVYYDASHKHGMVATNGKPCVFLAVVIRDQEGRMG
ncbi:MAG: helix-turn-helix domain-containing protein [Acetivibrionales bacterium]|nr:cupin domain-containing protein [Clostridiaceae bacterium]